MPCRLLPLEKKLLTNPLTGFKRTRSAERQPLPVSGESPCIFLGDLIVTPVDAIYSVRIDKLEHHGVIARVPDVVLLSIEAGGIAEVTRKMNRAASVRLDFDYQALLQAGLAKILSPLAGERVSSNLRPPSSRPHRDLIGVPLGYRGGD